MVDPEDASGWTGTRWRHLKRGTTYEVIGVAKLQTALTEGLADETLMVVYRNDATGKLSVRSLYEFCDGRFEIITPVGGEDASGWTGADKHNPYRRS
jgi:hypothetical protein